MDPNTPLTDAEADAEAQRLIAAAYQPDPGPTATSYRDTSPIPAIGPTPPVAQPGKPPMSQQATDLSGLIKVISVGSLPVGVSLSLVVYTVGHADPVALAIVAGAPVALVAALARLMRRAKTSRTEHHHHYTGTVTQAHTTVTSHTRGLVARTQNQLPD
ncbi:hypothetical protein ACJ6WD_35595 [Streptomyces sp. VTCC 41912]|uniref:hypothetical protein n=1 Tax=Streptomyces sp. VTCC 41912 TaxID=3383243 RepID=UPI003896EAE7